MKKGNSFSIGSKSLGEFQSMLEAKIEELGVPSLAITFVNADLNIKDFQQYLDKKKIIHIGSSSNGEICNENFYQGMFTGLFMYLPRESFQIYKSNPDDDELSGTTLGLFAKKQYANPGIYMNIASMESQTDLYIKNLQKSTSDKIPLYGGHAIDNLKFKEYTVFSNGYINNNGVVAVIFNCNQVEIYGDSYSGWDSVGTTHVITKSEKNELLEIDGKPALDVFIEYFDYFDLEKAAKGEDDRFIIGNHPIKVIEEDGVSSLKSPIHLNLKKRSMTYYCSVPVGTKFKFCANPKMEISEKLLERIKSIKDGIIDLDCLLITSCASRHLVLGPYFKKEIKNIYDIWKKPMAGFLSGGEIGNVKESNISYFHNVTSVLTGFKVK